MLSDVSFTSYICWLHVHASSPFHTRCQRAKKVLWTTLPCTSEQLRNAVMSFAYNHNIWVIPIKCHNIELGILVSKSMKSGHCLWQNILDFGQGCTCTFSQDQMSQDYVFWELKRPCLFLSSGETDSPFLPFNGPMIPEWVPEIPSFLHSSVESLLLPNLDNYKYWWSLKGLSKIGKVSAPYRKESMEIWTSLTQYYNLTLRACSLSTSLMPCLSFLCFHIWSYLLPSQSPPQNVWSGTVNGSQGLEIYSPAPPFLNQEAKRPELQFQLCHKLTLGKWSKFWHSFSSSTKWDKTTLLASQDT